MKAAKMLTLQYIQSFQMKGRWDLFLRLKIYSIYKENRETSYSYDEVSHAVSVKWLVINGNCYDSFDVKKETLTRQSKNKSQYAGQRKFLKQTKKN